MNDNEFAIWKSLTARSSVLYAAEMATILSQMVWTPEEVDDNSRWLALHRELDPQVQYIADLARNNCVPATHKNNDKPYTLESVKLSPRDIKIVQLWIKTLVGALITTDYD